jgi:hypothetical protein
MMTAMEGSRFKGAWQLLSGWTCGLSARIVLPGAREPHANASSER